MPFRHIIFVVAPQTSQDASVLTDSSGGLGVDGYPNPRI